MKNFRFKYIAFCFVLTFAFKANSETGLKLRPYGYLENFSSGGIGLRLPEMPQQLEEDKTGGFSAGLKSLIFGPRIGLQANDGIPVTFVEKANVFVPLVPFQVYPVSGLKGVAASIFLGPRIGMELNERKVRKMEWIGLAPVVGAGMHIAFTNPSTTTMVLELASAALLSRIIPAVEAYLGKTMSEIERRENLRR